MKFKISIVILMLFSFFNIGAASNIKINSKSFCYIESICMTKSEFVENGVKLQYKINTNIEDERKRVESYFINNRFNKSKTDELKFCKELLNVDCNLWSDSSYTYVDIVAVNTNKNCNSFELTNTVKGLLNYKCISVQYFNYYKGKTNDDIKEKSKNKINELSELLNLNKVDILELSNGCTGNAYYKDKVKINIATSTYDTGSYIIVGTPIIFTTY